MRNTITLDNVSPLIAYSPAGAWMDGDPAKDPSASRYQGGTFSVAQTPGASATLRFVGTGIRLFGAKRGNHDFFSVTLDGNSTRISGKASPDQFQALLFDSGPLQSAMHTLVLMDATTVTDPSESFLDVDFVEMDTDVGAQGIVIEDSAKFVQYSPATNAWIANGTEHLTTLNTASATLHFAGDAVDVYGRVGGSYTVTLDNHTPTSFTYSSTHVPTAPFLLFSARGLAPNAAHSVVLSNTGTGTPLSLDFAQVFGAQPSGLLPNTSPDTSASGGNTADAAIAAAGVLAGLLVAAICVIIVLVFRLRRTRQEQTPHTHKLDLAPDLDLEGGAYIPSQAFTANGMNLAATSYPYSSAYPSVVAPSVAQLSTGSHDPPMYEGK